MRPALVLIPGIQGRWEYLQPAIDALSVDFDVITFPLCGERGCEIADAAASIDDYAGLVARELDRRKIERAVIAGVSFGGVVALRFAATHPSRVLALVLASVPGPGWRLRPRHEFYARYPRIFGVAFLAETPFRLRPEIRAALSGGGWRRHVAWQLRTVVTAPMSLSRLAARARLMAGLDPAGDCARITAPTLIVTGEPGLDRVVQVEATRKYLELIPHAKAVVLERTGHQGSITRPHEFARIVRDFVFGARNAGEVRASA